MEHGDPQVSGSPTPAQDSTTVPFNQPALGGPHGDVSPGGDLTAYLLLEQAMCGCTDLCRCWWDEVDDDG